MLVKNIIILLFCWQLLYAQEEIALYPDVAPGSEDWAWSEQVSTKNLFNTPVIYNVVRPTITAYLPPYYLATGTAVIIAPGGGFHTLSIDSEGTDVAKWLNSKGVAAFVLKYRLTRSLTDDPVKELMGKMSDSASLDRDNEKTVPLAMADALAAIKYVRDHSGEMDIDPNKIGIMGFSAGGTLAMSVAYNASEQSRPNFVAPIYLYGGAIIGSEIPSSPTPIFVAVAGDDQLGLMSHSLDIYKKWFDAGQPAELHVYQKGGHGFGMRVQDLPTDTWYERFGEWLHLQGYLKKLYPNKYEKLYGQDAVARGKIERVAYLMKDYASMSRYQAANAKLSALPSQEDLIVFLGNSITDAWPSVDSLFFTQNNFIGRGISAQTSAQLLLRFRQDVIDLHPKVVVIHIGTNDVAENTGPYDPTYTMSNIQSMVDLARANSIKAIICSVLPATKFEWNRALGDRSDTILDLNRRLKSYADKNHIPYVDYHVAMKNDKNGMDPDIAEDGVHPTLKGYKLMEQLVLEKIKTTLE